MKYGEALKALREGQVSPIYLLVGEEQYLRRRFVRALRSSLDIPEDWLNYQRLEGDDAEADTVLTSCSMLTFDGGTRLVVAVEPPVFGKAVSAGEEKMWTSYLQDPSDSSCLCILVSQVDKRRRIYRAVADSESAVIISCERPKGDVLRRWIKKRVEADGKRISAQAMRTLASADISMDHLDRELQKLLTYIGDGDSIGADEVAEITSIPSEPDIFTLVDAVGMGRPRVALNVLQAMLTQGAAPLMLLAMIARQIRLIWHVRYEKMRGKSQSEVARRVGQPPFVVRKCSEQAENFSTGELERALELVMDTDMGIKRGRWEAEMAVERLIAILANQELKWSDHTTQLTR